MTESKPLYYEYPCNEQLRSYLRIEQLFDQINTMVASDDERHHVFAIQHIFHLIDYLHRNDVKASVLKHLDNRITEYVILESRPEVDVDKLENFLIQLRNLQQWIYKHHGKFGKFAQTEEFWSSLKRHFDGRQLMVVHEVPHLQYFLNLSPEVRRRRFSAALEEFQSIKTSINVLLNLLRTGAPKQDELAVAGFFQWDLQNSHCQLIRVKTTVKTELFPEFSVGNHRFIVRFRELKEGGELHLYEGNVEFQLHLCH